MHAICAIAFMAYFLTPSQIGVLDVDICGPSIPTIMGVAGEQVSFFFNVCVHGDVRYNVYFIN